MSCSKCGKKITIEDVESGEATATTYESGYKVYCNDCMEQDEYVEVRVLLINKEFDEALSKFLEQSRKDDGSEDLEQFMHIIQEGNLPSDVLDAFNEWLG